MASNAYRRHLLRTANHALVEPYGTETAETTAEEWAERVLYLLAALDEAESNVAVAWENRNRFCAAVNEIAQLVFDEPYKDCYDPDATIRRVRKVLNQYRNSNPHSKPNLNS